MLAQVQAYLSQGNIYADAKRKVTELVDNAKTSFYSAKIEASKLSKELFRNIRCIFGQVKSLPLPSGFDPCRLPHIFMLEFLTDKIRTIRNCFP